jgi:plasmid stabilization system protein ParE
MKITLSAVAEDDLAAISDWYCQFNTQLAVGFLNDFEETCTVIAQFPHSGVLFRKKYRQFVMNGFPYLIIYQLINETIVIISVVHNNRSHRNRLKGTGK